jgi:Lanthionine synthetase C-like protein/HopA1 effector protein family
MNTYPGQLEAIVGACQLQLPRAFTWFGTRQVAVPSALRALPADDVRTYLRMAIRERLYQDAYCIGQARTSRTQEELLGPTQDRSLADALTEANTAVGCWEPGWTVFGMEDSSCGVDSGTLQLWVAPANLRGGSTADVHVGEQVSVRMPTGSRELSPGYYSAFSDAPSTRLAEQTLVRVYLSLTPAGAPTAMKLITGALNAAEVPFRLKMLSVASDYSRADSAVLYLGANDLPGVAESLVSVFQALSPVLRDTEPLFTRHLAPGIGLAEEPSATDSFGQHRCGLVADGLIAAAEQEAPSQKDRLNHVLQAWQDAGVSADRPYLNPGSADAGYDCLVLPSSARVASSQHRPAVNRSGAGQQTSTRHISVKVGTPTLEAKSRPAACDALEVASSIGQRLVDEAVWHDDHCTWLGVVPTTDDQGRPTLAYGAVGRTLYDGSAGIGLFLALLGAVTGSSAVRATAQAAARQSLAQHATSLTRPGPGLYTGTTGQALAAATTGVLTGDNNLVHAGVRSLDRPNTYNEPDVLSGSAGTVLALLTLSTLANEDRLTGVAVTYGDHLLHSAQRGQHGWSWAPPGKVNSPDLTGLSHGAGGIGVTLAELAAATGDERYAAAAVGAFDYERSWFDPRKGNWADLRDQPRRASRRAPWVFRSQWCHGAPGLALARMRAADILDEPTLRAEGMIAFDTTRRDTRDALLTGSLGFSLCHGLAGNAEILQDGLPLMDQRAAADARALLDDINLTGYQRHVAGADPWTCGVPVPDLEVPGLLLGLAGIGYHYLRTAYPQLPSLLLLEPGSFARRIQAFAAGKHPIGPTPLEDDNA